MRRRTDADEARDLARMRPRVPRIALPARRDSDVGAGSAGMTHEELVAALRDLEGLRDVGTRHPNFHFRDKPFLHFHEGPEGIYADVCFGTADFEPVWASTPAEREALLARVEKHVGRIERTRKRR